MSTRLEFKTSRSNLTLIADAFGNPSDQPVLLLHGGGQTRHSWGGAAQILADKGFYAIALDLRGHGESDWAGDKDYHFTAFAQDVIDVAATLSQKPIAVGASLGGISSLHAHNIADQNLLKALVLVDITTQIEPEGLAKIRDFMVERSKVGFASLEDAADYVAAYKNQSRNTGNLDGLRKNLRLCEDGRYRWHWDPDFLTNADRLDQNGNTVSVTFLEEAAKKLSIPTLLVRGQVSDITSLESAKAFLKLAPHAQFVDVADAGHMIAGDQNDAFTEAVVSFLQTV